jgi:DNA-binding HxlR family transcriptional regulator
VKKATNQPRLLPRLESAFSKVRILARAEMRPADALAISESLRRLGRAVASPALNRRLRSLVRSGLLKTNSARSPRSRLTYSLTASGQRALHLAREQLSRLVEPDASLPGQ